MVVTQRASLPAKHMYWHPRKLTQILYSRQVSFGLEDHASGSETPVRITKHRVRSEAPESTPFWRMELLYHQKNI